MAVQSVLPNVPTTIYLYVSTYQNTGTSDFRLYWKNMYTQTISYINNWTSSTGGSYSAVRSYTFDQWMDSAFNCQLYVQFRDQGRFDTYSTWWEPTPLLDNLVGTYISRLQEAIISCAMCTSLQEYTCETSYGVRKSTTPSSTVMSFGIKFSIQNTWVSPENYPCSQYIKILDGYPEQIGGGQHIVRVLFNQSEYQGSPLAITSRNAYLLSNYKFLNDIKGARYDIRTFDTASSYNRLAVIASDSMRVGVYNALRTCVSSLGSIATVEAAGMGIFAQLGIFPQMTFNVPSISQPTYPFYTARIVMTGSDSIRVSVWNTTGNYVYVRYGIPYYNNYFMTDGAGSGTNQLTTLSGTIVCIFYFADSQNFATDSFTINPVTLSYSTMLQSAYATPDTDITYTIPLTTSFRYTGPAIAASFIVSYLTKDAPEPSPPQPPDPPVPSPTDNSASGNDFTVRQERAVEETKEVLRIDRLLVSKQYTPDEALQEQGVKLFKHVQQHGPDALKSQRITPEQIIQSKDIKLSDIEQAARKFIPQNTLDQAWYSQAFLWQAQNSADQYIRDITKFANSKEGFEWIKKNEKTLATQDWFDFQRTIPQLSAEIDLSEYPMLLDKRIVFSLLTRYPQYIYDHGKELNKVLTRKNWFVSHPFYQSPVDSYSQFKQYPFNQTTYTHPYLHAKGTSDTVPGAYLFPYDYNNSTDVKYKLPQSMVGLPENWLDLPDKHIVEFAIEKGFGGWDNFEKNVKEIIVKAKASTNDYGNNKAWMTAKKVGEYLYPVAKALLLGYLGHMLNPMYGFAISAHIPALESVGNYALTGEWQEPTEGDYITMLVQYLAGYAMIGGLHQLSLSRFGVKDLAKAGAFITPYVAKGVQDGTIQNAVTNVFFTWATGGLDATVTNMEKAEIPGLSNMIANLDPKTKTLVGIMIQFYKQNGISEKANQDLDVIAHAIEAFSGGEYTAKQVNDFIASGPGMVIKGIYMLESGIQDPRFNMAASIVAGVAVSKGYQALRKEIGKGLTEVKHQVQKEQLRTEAKIEEVLKKGKEELEISLKKRKQEIDKNLKKIKDDLTKPFKPSPPAPQPRRVIETVPIIYEGWDLTTDAENEADIRRTYQDIQNGIEETILNVSKLPDFTYSPFYLPDPKLPSPDKYVRKAAPPPPPAPSKMADVIDSAQKRVEDEIKRLQAKSTYEILKEAKQQRQDAEKQRWAEMTEQEKYYARLAGEEEPVEESDIEFVKEVLQNNKENIKGMFASYAKDMGVPTGLFQDLGDVLKNYSMYGYESAAEMAQHLATYAKNDMRNDMNRLADSLQRGGVAAFRALDEGSRYVEDKGEELYEKGKGWYDTVYDWTVNNKFVVGLGLAMGLTAGVGGTYLYYNQPQPLKTDPEVERRYRDELALKIKRQREIQAQKEEDERQRRIKLARQSQPEIITITTPNVQSQIQTEPTLINLNRVPIDMYRQYYHASVNTIAGSMQPDDLAGLLAPNLSVTNDGRALIIHSVHQYLHLMQRSIDFENPLTQGIIARSLAAFFVEAKTACQMAGNTKGVIMFTILKALVHPETAQEWKIHEKLEQYTTYKLGISSMNRLAHEDHNFEALHSVMRKPNLITDFVEKVMAASHNYTLSSTGALYAQDRYRPSYGLPQQPMFIREYKTHIPRKREAKSIYKQQVPLRLPYNEPRLQDEYNANRSFELARRRFK